MSKKEVETTSLSAGVKLSIVSQVMIQHVHIFLNHFTDIHSVSFVSDSLLSNMLLMLCALYYERMILSMSGPRQEDGLGLNNDIKTGWSRF